MRRFFVWVTLLVVAVLGLSGTARAAVQVNESVPIAGSQAPQFIPCANGGSGENVDFVGGSLHILFTFTVSTNQVSGKFKFQPEGVTAIGEITGDTYHGTGVTQGMFTTSLQNGQAESTFVDNFRIIGPGPGNNYLEHEIVVVTFNASGTVTVSFDSLTVDCK